MVEPVSITAPMPEVEEPIISLDFNDDFLSSQLSCSMSSSSSTVSTVPSYKPTPIQHTTDEVIMGRIEGLENKLQTNNEAMMCYQTTSLEIVQQLKDIRGMLEAKDNKFKSISLSENNRDKVLDTYSDCQQRYDRHGVPFQDRKDPRACYTSRHHYTYWTVYYVKGTGLVVLVQFNLWFCFVFLIKCQVERDL